MGFCTQCGATLDNEAHFCESCGAPVATAASHAHRESVEIGKTPILASPVGTTGKRGFARWMTTLLAAGALVAGGCLGWVAGVAHASRQVSATSVVDNVATEDAGTSLLGALTGYNRYVVRSQVSEGMALADEPKIAIGEYYASNGRFPSSNHEASLEAADTIVGKYVASVGIDGRAGLVRVTFSQQANAAIAGRVLTFVPVASAGTIQWSCGSTGTTVPREYLPASCTSG